METTITIRGRSITFSDIQRIQSFMDEHPHWHRTKLSQALCIAWDWKTHNGQYKDMACRGLAGRKEANRLQPPIVARYFGQRDKV